MSLFIASIITFVTVSVNAQKNEIKFGEVTLMELAQKKHLCYHN